MQCNGGSRSGLCKSTLQRRLEPWRWGSQWPPFRSWQWQIEWIIIADPLRTTWEVAQELYIDHSTVTEHLKQAGKVKSRFYMTTSSVTRLRSSKVKLLSRIQLFVTPWAVAYQASLSMGFSRQVNWSGLPFLSPEKLQSSSQNETYTKRRVMVSHSLVVCCLFDPLQLSESQPNHYIWEACPANWRDALKTAMPAASTGQQKGPNSSPR